MHCLREDRRESVSKNNGVFNPYPCPRPSFILSSFSSCITEISSAPWGLDENVTQYDSPCSYLSYRPCFSSLKDTLRESPAVVSWTEELLSFFLSFYPLKSILLKKNQDKESFRSFYINLVGKIFGGLDIFFLEGRFLWMMIFFEFWDD